MNSFVILAAFYPPVLIVSHKLSIHHQLRELSDTLGFLYKQKEGKCLRYYILLYAGSTPMRYDAAKLLNSAVISVLSYYSFSE